ncbi:hypothetical protein [uncultured Methylophaga sp.]|jgi:hypothetical protein|uniref:hypothetical protein n=1 Tax=uncultured Methylophaga sp. TaxID=285271 RepID=UPI00262A8A69|nr:hypothetical protein [uncultured Methylophaga sp.]
MLIIKRKSVGTAYAKSFIVINRAGRKAMGYFIDLMYLLKELVKLVFMVMISPLGLVAGVLVAWG